MNKERHLSQPIDCYMTPTLIVFFSLFSSLPFSRSAVCCSFEAHQRILSLLPLLTAIALQGGKARGPVALSAHPGSAANASIFLFDSSLPVQLLRDLFYALSAQVLPKVPCVLPRFASYCETTVESCKTTPKE